MTSQQGHAACKRIMSLFNKESMKYTPSNSVQVILRKWGYLGFDTLAQCEKAILGNPEWLYVWDTRDWLQSEVEEVTVWRESNVATNAVATISDTVLSRYFRIQSLNH